MNRLASVPHLPLWLALCGLLLAFHPLARGHSLRASDLAQTSSAVADPAAAVLEENLALWSAEQLREGAWPSWFLHRGFGVYVPRRAAAAVLHPVRAPVAFGGAAGLVLYYLLRLAIAVAGAYVLALQLGIRGSAAGFAGLAFGLSSPLLRQLQLAELDAAVVLPWFLVAVGWLGRDRHVPALVAMVVTGLGLLLGGGAPYAVAAVLGVIALSLGARRVVGGWDRSLVGLALIVVAGLGFGLFAGEVGTAIRPTAGIWAAVAGLGFDHPFAAGATTPGLAHAVAPFVLLFAAARIGVWLAMPLVLAVVFVLLGPSGRGGSVLMALVFALAAAAGIARWGEQCARRRGLRCLVVVLGFAGVGVLVCVDMGLHWGRLGLTLAVALCAVLFAGRLHAWLRPRGALMIGALSLCVLAPWHWGVAEPVAGGRPDFVAPLLQRRLIGGRFVTDGERPDSSDCVRYGLYDLRPWPGVSVRQDRFFREVLPEIVAPSGERQGAADLGNLRYLVRATAGGYAVETRATLPFAFFPRSTQSVGNAAEALARVKELEFDALAVSYLESDLTMSGQLSGIAVVSPEQAAGEVRLRVQCAAETWLCVSLEGGAWLRAEVDGESAPVVRANYVGTAVRVPRGRHEVRLFSEDATTPGPWGLLCAVSGVVWALRRMRRNPEVAIDRAADPRQTISPQLPHGGYSSAG